MRFFNDHEGDVVGLWRALSEILNGIQQALLNRVTSRVGIALNHLSLRAWMEECAANIRCEADKHGGRNIAVLRVPELEATETLPGK